jgi:ABC-2 type transport system ATP-binding protein
MTDAIVTSRLTKFFGSQCAVNNLNLRVPAGSVYGFLGRNGAGKSTTIRMLLGMSQPNFGRAELLGHDIRAMPSEVRGRIAFLAEGHPLVPWMTVAEILRFHRAFHAAHWNQEILDQALAHFKLPVRKPIRRLSFGQRAQVALAVAIAPDPDLLILDDPTAGLDTVARRDILVSLIQLIQRDGRTILFSSHILSDVQRVADRIGILIDGVLRVDCRTADFMDGVRKVVLRFPGEPPRFPGCEGLISARGNGQRLELVIRNFGDSQREIVESLEPADIDVLDMNLEDACIEYTRGAQDAFFGGDREPAHGHRRSDERGGETL